MRLGRIPQPRERPPDNELYDRGCDLVEAAQAIRELAGGRGAERAVPAVLGCIESALQALGAATQNLDATGGQADAPDATTRRLHRGYVNLATALADAESACAAARGLAGRTRGAR